MWWVILSSVLMHGLLAITFGCVETNFMVCLSYLCRTLKEKAIGSEDKLCYSSAHVIQRCVGRESMASYNLNLGT